MGVESHLLGFQEFFVFEDNCPGLPHIFRSFVELLRSECGTVFLNDFANIVVIVEILPIPRKSNKLQDRSCFKTTMSMIIDI